jgi:hypothetical protein
VGQLAKTIATAASFLFSETAGCAVIEGLRDFLLTGLFSKVYSFFFIAIIVSHTEKETTLYCVRHGSFPAFLFSLLQ